MSVQPLRTEPLVPAQPVPYDSFDAFDRVFRPRLTRYLRCCYRGDRGVDVPEAVQETLTRAFVGFDRLDPRRDPWPWLVVVARNVIVDMRRRDMRLVTADDEALSAVEDARPLPDELVVHDEQRALLVRALDAVPPAQRTVLTLRIVEERTFSEIAALLGRTENSVRQTLFRGRASLASHFAAMGGKHFGLAPVAAIVAAMRAMRRGAGRATPATMPAAGTVLAASLAIGAGLFVQAGPVFAGSELTDLTGSTVESAVSSTVPTASRAGSSVGSTGATGAAARRAMAPALTQVSTDNAGVSVARHPLAKGRTYVVSARLTTPAGTVRVEAVDDKSDDATVCRMDLVRCP